jgi:hypothetical protein
MLSNNKFKVSDKNLEWLLESDPALRWQVEKDLAGKDQSIWERTRTSIATAGFGAQLLALQDDDGQWAAGAYFPGREEPRALVRPGDEHGQSYLATTWTLNTLREWGLDASRLAGTAEALAANCRWDYDDLPYWGGEVDCCINAFTLANGVWLGADVESIAEWFIEHQMQDGGWNCEWVEGDTRSSFHSTLNSLFGILWYERAIGGHAELKKARKKAEEYLLQRKLLYRLGTGTWVGPWVSHFAYPFRWRYTALRAIDYFKQSCEYEDLVPDLRAAEAVDLVRRYQNQNGRWVQNTRPLGATWFDVDVPVGQESKWLTFYASRALTWWDSQQS